MLSSRKADVTELGADSIRPLLVELRSSKSGYDVVDFLQGMQKLVVGVLRGKLQFQNQTIHFIDQLKAQYVTSLNCKWFI